jgi:competence protein ComEC
MIAEKSNTNLKVFHNLDSLTKSKDNTLKNYRIGNYISELKNDTLKSVYRFNDKTFLIIDSLGVYNVNSFKPDYILLRNSPRINLKRVIDSLQPQHIIADASNYKSYVKRWKETCEKEKLPFHSTYEKGAFIIKD